VIQLVRRHINVNYDIMKTERQFGVAVVINNDTSPLFGYAAKAAHFNQKSVDVPQYYCAVICIIRHTGHLNRWLRFCQSLHPAGSSQRNTATKSQYYLENKCGYHRRALFLGHRIDGQNAPCLQNKFAGGVRATVERFQFRSVPRGRLH